MDTVKTIVLENTRVCNLRCRICPTRYAADYPAGVMSMYIFDSILEHVPQTIKQVGLTGWGECLLDPSYTTKLKKLKERGLIVGSTTNATLLTQEKVREIVDLGLDYLAISIDPFHLEAQKLSSSQLMTKLEAIFNIRDKGNRNLHISLNCVVGRLYIAETATLVENLAALPWTSINFVPAILIPSEEVLAQLIRHSEYLEFKENISTRIKNRSMHFSYLDDVPRRNCRSDIFGALYVGIDGRVFPCCVLSLQVNNFTFDRKRRKTSLVSFGNLVTTGLEEIWQCEDYVKFRETFFRGAIPKICRCCNAWRGLP